jgi:cysteinyl-tRNA synthetase
VDTPTSPSPELIELLIELRAVARDAGDWATADRIRVTLARSGVELRDTPEGTVWSLGR